MNKVMSPGRHNLPGSHHQSITAGALSDLTSAFSSVSWIGARTVNHGCSQATFCGFHQDLGFFKKYLVTKEWI